MKSKKINIKSHYLILIISVLILSCTNPFAPKSIDFTGVPAILGDQTTIEGVFTNFGYAYKMKDTVVYGNLLADDFTFIFRNYDREPVVDESWGREIDMITTYGLFKGTQRLDLVWNDITSLIQDSLLVNVWRSFVLEVAFSPDDRFKLQGKVNFTLVKAAEDAPWKILQWRDETNN
ncbi:hypothetical protein ACFLSQ_00970 [Bacteroidota bacterium]